MTFITYWKKYDRMTDASAKGASQTIKTREVTMWDHSIPITYIVIEELHPMIALSSNSIEHSTHEMTLVQTGRN